jgi:hypothetical protein
MESAMALRSVYGRDGKAPGVQGTTDFRLTRHAESEMTGRIPLALVQAVAENP